MIDRGKSKHNLLAPNELTQYTLLTGAYVNRLGACMTTLQSVKLNKYIVFAWENTYLWRINMNANE